MKILKRKPLAAFAASAVLMLGAQAAVADMAAAKKWVNDEFQPSTITKQQQMDEMAWFIDAAKPFQGMHIRVASEGITTHTYESATLAKAFEEITGIKVTHDIIGEGDVVEKLQTQMQSGENLYDAYVNDSDLIGTHWRYKQVRNLTDWMANAGADVTLPTLDIKTLLVYLLLLDQTVSYTNYQTSSLPTCIGSAMTYLQIQRSRQNLKPYMVMILVYQLTGRLTKI